MTEHTSDHGQERRDPETGLRIFHQHGEPADRLVPYSFEEPLACPVGDEKGKEHFWDDPSHVKWLLRIFYGACAILFAIDFFFHRHVEHPLEGWWGFYPLYGFISCTLLVLAAKEMRKVLIRGDDYYDAD